MAIESGGGRPDNPEQGRHGPVSKPVGESLGETGAPQGIKGIHGAGSHREHPLQQHLSGGTSAGGESGERVPSRRDILQAEFPHTFLGQVGPSGITHDYNNEIFSADMAIEVYDPEAARQAIAQTKTYSEYWRARIAGYNEAAAKSGATLVDPERAFEALVTEQPGAADLDTIALSIRSLADQDEFSKVDLRRVFDPLSENAKQIIHPRPAEPVITEADPPAETDVRDFLRDFNVPESVLSSLNPRGVDARYLDVIKATVDRVQSADVTPEEARSILAGLPTYGEFLGNALPLPDDVPPQDRDQIVNTLLSTPEGAATFDEIADELHGYAEADPQSEDVKAAIADAYFTAYGAAHGIEAEMQLRGELPPDDSTTE